MTTIPQTAPASKGHEGTYAERIASLTFEELRLERTRVAEECGAKILLAQQYADIEREWETRFAA